jgi:hypothetical protein
LNGLKLIGDFSNIILKEGDVVSIIPVMGDVQVPSIDKWLNTLNPGQVTHDVAEPFFSDKPFMENLADSLDRGITSTPVSELVSRDINRRIENNNAGQTVATIAGLIGGIIGGPVVGFALSGALGNYFRVMANRNKPGIPGMPNLAGGGGPTGPSGSEFPGFEGMNSFDSSQTYSWSPQTIQAAGGAIPRIYGTMKSYGNIITGYTDIIEEKSYLYTLIALCMGPISEISNLK